MFENDPKIDKLLMSQGCKGFVIYFYLCQKAYGSTGYYYSWRYDDCATTAKKLGGVVGADTVRDTVRFCVQVGLFDGKLLEAGILTSRGIQRRFREVAKTRTGNIINPDYWLLNDGNNAGLNFCTQNSNFAERNTHLPPRNANFQAGNSTKVKESKVKIKNKNTLSGKPDRACVKTNRLDESEKPDDPIAVDNGGIRGKVMDYLNKTCGTRFRLSSKTTVSLIDARLKEGYTLDDFIKVIDNKCRDWRDRSEMARYLRPQTLFGSKFEAYLNQPQVRELSKADKALMDTLNYEFVGDYFDE